MLFAKGKEAVVAFNQIRDYNVTVIITVDILYAEDGICFVLRQYRHYGAVFAEEQDGCQSNPLLLSKIISKNQAGAAEQFFI